MKLRSCIEKIRHNTPDCKSSSGKSLQVWLNEEQDGRKHFSGYCFACSKLVPDPYGNNPPDPEKIKVKTPEEIQEEMDEIISCGYVETNHRCISPEWWKFYGVRQLYSEFDGVTPNAIAHPYTRNGAIVRWVIKLMNKKIMWSIGDTQNNDPYGWERAKLAGGSTLYITEGAEDTIALTEILKTMNRGTDYEDLDFAIISLNDGCDSVQKTLGPKIAEINQRWEKIVIVFDNDEPGKKAAKEACRLFPHAHVAILPALDANDCLKRGFLKQTREAVLWRAAKPRPSNLVNKAQLLESMEEKVKEGPSYPWPAMTKAAQGQRRGEVVSLGGTEGGGKTTIARQIVEHDITHHDWSALTMFMEETPQQTLRRLAGIRDKFPYHDPHSEYDIEQLKRTSELLLKNLEFWDRKEQGEDSYETWEGMKSCIRNVGKEIDLVVIDNWTILSEGLSTADRNDFLGKVYADMVKLSEQFQFMALCLSHLNPKQKGQRPHELGGKVLKSEFTGSRAAAKYSHYMFGLERNLQAIDPCCSIIRGLKSRESGKLEAFKTYYESDSGIIVQRQWDDADFETKEIVHLKRQNNAQ